MRRIQFSYLILIVFLITFGLSNTGSSYNFPESYDLVDKSPKVNIILLIGDGMGPEHVRLARLVEKGYNGLLSFESFPFQMNVTTRSADFSVTDSSAAATAISTGVKTNNGYVAVSPNGTQLKTILEIAKDLNLSTGMVTTSEATHGTPASFASHVLNRNSFSDIAEFYANNKTVDILLGGGKSLFPNETIDTFLSNNYTLVENRSQLLDYSGSKLLGLFSPSHIPYELDRDRTITPSLSEMTSKSLEILINNPNGFFLMVEGAKIDHAAHGRDLDRNILETIEFAEAAEVVHEFAKSNPNTLVIVTADHETGNLITLNENLDDTILPTSTMTEDEAENLKLDRISNISAIFSTTSHTNKDVGFYGFGSDFEGYTNGSEIDNTEIFTIMNNYLQNADSLQRSEPIISSVNGSESSVIGFQLIVLLIGIISYKIRRRQ
jgi:alkaline phosphatase